ncbi:MAG: hypothetical protein AAF572_27135 [Cyanobacteria bacterium P01_B01_bin.77]
MSKKKYIVITTFLSAGLSMNALASPDDFVDTFTINDVCDGHMPSHFIRGKTFSLIKDPADPTGETLIFEAPFDFGDSAWRNAKFKWVKGLPWAGSTLCQDLPNTHNMNPHDAQAVLKLQSRYLEAISFTTEHLHDRLKLDNGGLKDVYVYVRRNEEGEVEDYMIKFTKVSGTIHNGRIH